MRPKVVVFDLGKVLVDFDYGIAARKLAASAKVSAGEISRLIDQSPLLVQFETGLMDNTGFFREVCNATGFCGGQPEFDALFADIFSPIDAMIDLHSQLRGAKVPTYIFSNTNGIAIRHIRERFPFFATFTDYVFSYEHGAMKPDALLYSAVEKVSGSSGREILYLDDRPENVAAGEKRGWQTILHTSPQQSISVIRKLGLL